MHSTRGILLHEYRQRNRLVVDTESHGTLLLRSYLTVGELEHFWRARGKESPRRITAQVIGLLLIEPELSAEEIEGWSDEQLLHVADAWCSQKSGSNWHISDELTPFDLFVEGLDSEWTQFSEELLESFNRIYLPVFQTVSQELGAAATQAILRLGESLNQLAQSVIEPFQQDIVNIANSARFDYSRKLGSFFDNLPDFRKIEDARADYERVAQALDKGGFGFMLNHWSLREFARFVDLNSIDSRVRSAVVTNRLLGITRSERFSARLGQLFEGSSTLSRRWAILKLALSSHRSRQYAIAIPALLAQVEGIFTDALVLKAIVEKVNGRLYAKDATGNLKKNRKGDLIELHGLGQKVDNSDLKNEPTLTDLADFFTCFLVRERNDILHGRNVTYPRARLSVQLLLNIYLLALEFDHFEGGSLK